MIAVALPKTIYLNINIFLSVGQQKLSLRGTENPNYLENSHQTEKCLSYNLNSPEWTIEEMHDIHYQDMLSYVTDDTRMEAFRMDQPHIYRYPDPPENYYNENPDWKWREDLRKVSSPEPGKKAVEAIATHLVEMIREALKERIRGIRVWGYKRLIGL